MTLTLDLPPEVEGALAEAARRQGTTPERLAINRLRDSFVTPTPLSQRVLHPYNEEAFTAALDALDQGDEEEQRKTLEHLKVALDRNRPGERSIFGQGIKPHAF